MAQVKGPRLVAIVVDVSPCRKTAGLEVARLRRPIRVRPLAGQGTARPTAIADVVAGLPLGPKSCRRHCHFRLRPTAALAEQAGCPLYGNIRPILRNRSGRP